MSSLGGHVGHGLEQVVKEIVEEFAGQAFPSAERLVLRDETGEVFGVAGAEAAAPSYAACTSTTNRCPRACSPASTWPMWER